MTRRARWSIGCRYVGIPNRERLRSVAGFSETDLHLDQVKT